MIGIDLDFVILDIVPYLDLLFKKLLNDLKKEKRFFFRRSDSQVRLRVVYTVRNTDNGIKKDSKDQVYLLLCRLIHILFTVGRGSPF